MFYLWHKVHKISGWFLCVMWSRGSRFIFSHMKIQLILPSFLNFFKSCFPPGLRSSAFVENQVRINESLSNLSSFPLQQCLFSWQWCHFICLNLSQSFAFYCTFSHWLVSFHQRKFCWGFSWNLRFLWNFSSIWGEPTSLKYEIF